MLKNVSLFVSLFVCKLLVINVSRGIYLIFFSSKTYDVTYGLQDPILGQTLSFAIHKSEPFVQVLHDGCLHWVCISTVKCSPGEVILMDSMFSGNISVAVKRQICAILHCEHKNLTKVIFFFLLIQKSLV